MGFRNLRGKLENQFVIVLMGFLFICSSLFLLRWKSCLHCLRQQSMMLTIQAWPISSSSTQVRYHRFMSCEEPFFLNHISRIRFLKPETFNLFTTSESPKYSNPPIFCCLQNFVFFLIKSRAKYWNHATFSNSDSMGVQLKALKYVIQNYF